MQSTPAPAIPTRAACAVLFACGVLLSACGGGGSGRSTDTDGSTATTLSQSVATADASNATQTAADTSAALDTIYDTTQGLALAAATGAAAASDRARVSAAAPTPQGVVIDCGGGGTATLTISGGTPADELDGVLDAGERYTMTYAQCSGGPGLAALDGSVEMDVTSVSGDATPVTAATLTLTGLSTSFALGSMTLDGSANLSRTETTAGDVTTRTSHVTAASLSLATSFNTREGNFTLADVDATRTVESTTGITTGSQYTGAHTLSGMADGRTFSSVVSTDGAVDYDASGMPVSGQWTTVRPDATIVTSIGDGNVTLTVDDGNDGTIDHTWTFPIAVLQGAAG